jgi:cyclopropane-fatty-acyl-phospholipid synthase
MKTLQRAPRGRAKQDSTTSSGRAVSDIVTPLVENLLHGSTPVPVEFWDGSAIGGPHETDAIVLRSPDALRRLAWSPSELGLARAFVAGDMDITGEAPRVLRALQNGAPGKIRFGIGSIAKLLGAAARVGAFGRPLPPPPEEVLPRGARHSPRRDARVVRHHYDAGNEFYRLLLGPSMTYSCARFVASDSSLDEAQDAKHDLICRKLGLHTSSEPRLLDVGCGWGSMALHAARTYGASVVGVTLSQEQAREASRRVAEAGLGSKIDIRVQDYRDIRGEQFDAISSIGMFEHVGREQTATYFSTMRRLLVDRGRLLNHAISSVGGSRLGRNSFMYRYVFPDGELLDVGDTVVAMERAGFEVRDIEALREHYAQTLRCWLANLEQRYDDAVALVGEGRARVWRLYISGCINGFDDGGVSIHQVLGVISDSQGRSGMPSTRTDWG